MLIIAQIQAIKDSLTRILGKVLLTDGTNTASVRDVTSAKAIDVAINDASGNQITSFGGSPIHANPKPYSGSVTSGSTLATLDFNADLGRNAKDWYVINDGPGDITIEVSYNGTTFATAFTWKATDGPFSLYMECDSIKINYVSATAAYRAVAL